jgi:aspartyl-tRNA(Asn)/glutamyl-tRNA(Gln) amidotransferase subunit A
LSTRHLSRRSVLTGIAASSGAAFLGMPGCSLFRGSSRAVGRDPAQLDLRDASLALRARSLSPVDLTNACLERIRRLDSRLNSFTTVTPERALAEAREAEGEIARGRWRGPLHGIPIAVKDNVDTAGVRTTAASAVFAERVPTEDAEAVRRLRQAGAIVLGKLNMHEFAMGTTSAISHFGPVHNPWDLQRIAGGSSGGSGAAVAAGLCFGAVGTDTGGSIRIPAACCGIVGLKPTFGVVSARGTVPVSPSFDHVGPMCRTVGDAALMFRAMASHRVAIDCDPEALPPTPNLRVGVLQTTGGVCDAPVEPEVAAAVDAAVEVIRRLVAEVREAELPMPDLGALIDAEAYAFHRLHLEAAPERYDARTRKDALAGEGISEADSARLRRELERHRASVHEAFSLVDLVVLPTLPGLPLLIRDATEPFALPACTFAFSVGGLPAISVPCGFSRSGLPIGLLIGGPPLSEPRILALAQAYEHATDWHRRRPPLWNLT